MPDAETLIRVVLGTLSVAGAAVFFLAPESRASRPPLPTRWASGTRFTDTRSDASAADEVQGSRSRSSTVRDDAAVGHAFEPTTGPLAAPHTDTGRPALHPSIWVRGVGEPQAFDSSNPDVARP